jgi:hypothetical protein
MVDDFPHQRLSGSVETEGDQAPSLSGQAVVGLALGMLSVGAMIAPPLWLLPAAGLLFSARALWRIAAARGALVGRKVALAGLFLSLLFGCTALAEHFVYRWFLQREAGQFAQHWFDFLRRDEPMKAYQLAVPPDRRAPFDEKLAGVFDDRRKRSDLQGYLRQPEVRALLALGAKATARLHRIGYAWRHRGLQYIEMYYGATYQDEDGRKKTFFVRMVLARMPIEKRQQAGWYIASSELAKRPPAIGDAPIDG